MVICWTLVIPEKLIFKNMRLSFEFTRKFFVIGRLVRLLCEWKKISMWYFLLQLRRPDSKLKSPSTICLYFFDAHPELWVGNPARHRPRAATDLALRLGTGRDFLLRAEPRIRVPYELDCELRLGSARLEILRAAPSLTLHISRKRRTIEINVLMVILFLSVWKEALRNVLELLCNFQQKFLFFSLVNTVSERKITEIQ